MKTKKTMNTSKMTDAEIKEAIRRDKEWMDNIGPDDEIEIPEGGVKALFGDDDDEPSEDNDSEEFDAEVETEEDEVDEDDINDDDTKDVDEDDDDLGTSGAGGILGALIGGIGGVVIGGILGTALFDD